MCFRPAGLGIDDYACPHCGKTIDGVSGAKLKKCPYCKEALPTMGADGAAGPPIAPPAPSGPPRIPQAPKREPRSS